jgi:hypothetical protein
MLFSPFSIALSESARGPFAGILRAANASGNAFLHLCVDDGYSGQWHTGSCHSFRSLSAFFDA